VGARVDVDALPVSDATRAAAGALRVDPLGWALSGGEDYELLFTARPEWEGLLAGLVRRLRVPVTRIGSVRPAREGIRLLTPEGRYRPLPPAAFEHFRKSGR